MEQRQNTRAGKTGNPRENPPTSGIFRHDNHLRKSGSYPHWESTPVRLGGRRAWLDYSPPTCQPPVAHSVGAPPVWDMGGSRFESQIRHGYKIDVKHIYSEVTFAIGAEFIKHALDDSEPIEDLQGKKVANTLLPGTNRVRFLAGSLPNFLTWGSCRTIPLIGGFSRGSPVSSRPCITVLLQTHLASPSPALKTSMSRATQISSTHFTPETWAVSELADFVDEMITSRRLKLLEGNASQWDSLPHTPQDSGVSLLVLSSLRSFTHPPPLHPPTFSPTFELTSGVTNKLGQRRDASAMSLVRSSTESASGAGLPMNGLFNDPAVLPKPAAANIETKVAHLDPPLSPERRACCLVDYPSASRPLPPLKKPTVGARIFRELGHSAQLGSRRNFWMTVYDTIYIYCRGAVASSLGEGHPAECGSEVRCRTRDDASGRGVRSMNGRKDVKPDE
ncbi:hypothetical protein PR048_026224 [Dryococelus australis]|uniref:Uncharacterized protein n=1 Tax=Dryococelus australis TaxID=614101 RepID=A0ABQ9GKU4_9NEOP|nr:hypothetical protein PR048_026224 [Dryococelus australis]